MQITTARGYLPPTDGDITEASKAIDLKMKASGFIRDVCNMNAGGRFVTPTELDGRIASELERYPIKLQRGSPPSFARTDTSRASSYETYEEAEISFREDHKRLAKRMKDAVETLPSMEVPGNSPMEQALNLLKILSEQKNKKGKGQKGEGEGDGDADEEGEGDGDGDGEGESDSESSSRKHGTGANKGKGSGMGEDGEADTDLLNELLSATNMEKARENLREATDMSPSERELINNISDIKEGKDSPGKGGGAGKNKPDNDCKKKAKEIMKTAINLSDEQLREVVRISRKLQAFSKLKTAKETKFRADPEGDQVQNRMMKDVSEISRVRPSYLAEKQTTPRLFNMNAVTGQMQVRERGIFMEKKQLLYVAVDCSGSMAEGKRIKLAAGILVNRLMAVAKGDAVVFWRFFDTYAHTPMSVLTESQAYESIQHALDRKNYSGGGTDFTSTLKTVVKHIEELTPTMNLARPEVMMVTDGECSCHLTLQDMRGIKLHTALVAPMAAEDITRLTEDTGGLVLRF